MQIIQRTGRLWRVLFTLLYTGLITIVLIQPETQPIIPTGIPPAPPSIERELLFGLAHVIGFALLTAFWLWTLSAYLAQNHTVIVTVTGIVCYGLLTEYIQSFVPGRSVQMLDVIANGTGLLLGLGIAAYYRNQQPGEHDASHSPA